MTVEEIKSTLANGVHKFVYTKKDGTERHAVGTRNADVISSNNATPTGNGTEKANVITYFDTEKEAWRSFCADSFGSFED